LFAIPQYKRMYEFYIREHLKDPYQTDSLYKELDYLAALIDTAIQSDPFYNGKFLSDYGFTYNDWKSSFSQAWGNHVSWGIKPFIGTRTTSAKQQMIFASSQQFRAPIAIQTYPNPCSEFVIIEHDLLASWQGDITVEAIDLQGRSVHLVFEAIPTNNQQIRISLENLAPGCYHLSVANKNSHSVQTPWITVVH